ncbi:hypothetical protein [Parvularcula sp. LCG005]|uniref:hypothetical protein n=1 Tax=Parvularcula sp. LCG005 TaxID=3078805 RepID=UPI0029423888|nr:hypothetical protein [Parvularcula sp. LCG005]WOI53956.1 hypothetical protein RUI03_02880 [Parvularcula sp. LCG005]
MRFVTPICAALFAALSSMAFAAPSFTEKDVVNFIDAVQKLEAVGDKYPDLDLENQFSGPDAMATMIDKDGNFQVFERILELTKGNQAFHNDVAAAVKSSGFSSLDSFATKADDISMVFMALNISQSDRDEMAQMTPEMMQMIPPQMKPQIEMALKLFEATANVSEEEKALVRPHLKDMEKAFN